MKTNKKKSIFCLVLALSVISAFYSIYAENEDIQRLKISEEDDESSSDILFPPISSFVSSDDNVKGRKPYTNESNSDLTNSTPKDTVDVVPESQNHLNDKNEPNDEFGLDNLSLPEEKIGFQGNWVKKREWLKESYKVNEQLQNILNEINLAPKSYQDKFNIIDAELDAFYKKEGFEQSSLSSLFNSINKYLVMKKRDIGKRAKGGVASDEEIEVGFLLKENKELKRNIKQLRLDIKSIYDLDRSIKDRIKKLNELVVIAMDEAHKASGLVDDIWDIIDDKKARAIFYELKGDSLEKIKAIKKYVTNTLKNDFDSFLELIRAQIKIVSASIKDLESKGIIFRDRVERLKKIKLNNSEYNSDDKKKIEERLSISFSMRVCNYLIDLFIRAHNFLSDL